MESICATSLLIKTLFTREVQFSLSFYPLLLEQHVKEILLERATYFIFIGCGGGLCKQFKKKHCLIIDSESEEYLHESIIHITDKKSVTETLYSLLNLLHNTTTSAQIAVVGSFASRYGIDKDVLAIALEQGVLHKERGLPIFGQQTRSIHKALEYSVELLIPGVTGNEGAALSLLSEVGIASKSGSLWRKFADLSKEEMASLIEIIALKKYCDKESLLVDRYILPHELPGPTRDVAEYAELIRACANMDQCSVAIGTLLGDKAMREKAIETEHLFRREIAKALAYYEENPKQEDKRCIILQGQDTISSRVIGSLATILTKRWKEKKFILITAYDEGQMVKASLRMSGRTTENLLHIAQTMVKSINGVCVGTKDAVSISVQRSKEEEFIAFAKSSLEQTALEEAIL